MQLCNRHCNDQFQNIFITAERNPAPFSYHPQSCLLPQPRETPDLLSVSINFLFGIFQVNGIVQYVVFCDWMFLLIIMFSWFIHVVACISTAFLYMARYYSIVWLYHTLFTHSSVDGHWGWFYFLAFINNAAMNISTQPSMWTYFKFLLCYVLRCRIAGSHVSMFSHLRNCQTFSQVVALFCTLTSSGVGLFWPDFSILTMGDLLC